MKDPTWARAWYPLIDDYVSVEYALDVRSRTGGEYRENPCYHDEKSYKNGYGISLFPRKESWDKKACFVRYSDDNNRRAIKIISENLGMKFSENSIYLNSVIRVSTMIRNINHGINNNLVSEMGIESFDSIMSIDDQNSEQLPDFIIQHKPTKENNFPNQTRVFIQDINRNPNFMVDEKNDWVLKINKWETDLVMDWSKGKELFYKEWLVFKKKYDRKNTRVKPSKGLLITADIVKHSLRKNHWRSLLPFYGGNISKNFNGIQTVTLKNSGEYYWEMIGFKHVRMSNLPISTPIVIMEQWRSKYYKHKIMGLSWSFCFELIEKPKLTIYRRRGEHLLSWQSFSSKHTGITRELKSEAWDAYKKEDIKRYISVCKKANFSPIVDISVTIRSGIKVPKINQSDRRLYSRLFKIPIAEEN